MNTELIDNNGDVWHEITDRTVKLELANELQREIARNKGHRLYGIGICFVAKCLKSDDYLIIQEGGELGMVHLTFQVESDPNWPGYLRVKDEFSRESLERLDLDWDSFDFQKMG
jgi:hypothetical protein